MRILFKNNNKTATFQLYQVVVFEMYREEYALKKERKKEEKKERKEERNTQNHKL